MELPQGGVWKHAFDAEEPGAGEVNPDLGRADAFTEIMTTAGAARDHVTVAVPRRRVAERQR